MADRKPVPGDVVTPLSRPLENPALRVGSLGLGVQSTVMALASRHGELEPFDALIFADGHREPFAVYEHLRFLTSPNVGLDVTTVSAGDILSDTLASAASWRGIGGSSAPRELWKTALRVANPPFFTRGPRVISKKVKLAPLPLFGTEGGEVEIQIERRTERETFGILRRSCTKEYKIEPITAKIRDLIGLKPGENGPSSPIVELSIGLTTDEIERLSTSLIPFIHHRHPLCEMRGGMKRSDCIQWLLRHGYPVPRKSRCFFCPFQTNELWQELKITEPELFEIACQMDDEIRDGIRGTLTKLYLHSARIPLREIDFTKPGDLWTVEGMRNECQGICGL